MCGGLQENSGRSGEQEECQHGPGLSAPTRSPGHPYRLLLRGWAGPGLGRDAGTRLSSELLTGQQVDQTPLALLIN